MLRATLESAEEVATVPKRSRSAAKPAKRFAPSERVFHLVSSDDFERRTIPAKGKRDSVEARTLRADALTTCCRRPARKVYAVAISRDSVEEGRGVKWCKGVTP